MSRSRQPHKIVVFAAALVFTLVGALASAVTADGGSPTPPFENPHNYVLNLPVKTQIGLICPAGKTSGSGCHWLPLGGTVITVRSMSGKLIRTAHTAANGRTIVRLPKGLSKLTFSHSPYKGRPLGTKTFTVKAPVYEPPPSYFLFNFCLSDADC